MTRNNLLFALGLVLCPFFLIAQNNTPPKKTGGQYAFITFPMMTESTPLPTREKALLSAMRVFKEADEVAANSVEITTCKITKIENLGTEKVDLPLKLANGKFDRFAGVPVLVKACAVTWDAEFTITKDIALGHLWEMHSLLDVKLISYFEKYLEAPFKERLLKSLYQEKTMLILKAGEKFKIVGIHSRMAGPAINDTWTCLFLRDEERVYPKAIASISLTKATTLDAKSVSVDYEIKEAAANFLHFEVYRSERPALDEHGDFADTYRKIGDTTVIDVGRLAEGTHNKVTLMPGVDLLPDTRLPYVVVIATCNGKKDTTYFRKWLIGAISHGFDRDAIHDIFFNPSLQNHLLDILSGDDKEHLYFYRKFYGSVLALPCKDLTMPDWEFKMAKSLKEIDNYDYVVSFDWMKTCALPEHVHAVEAGFRLADSVLKWVSFYAKHPGDVVDIHFIGHSRGTVIVTQALNVLKGKLKSDASPFGSSYVELTLLDPHPANNNLEPKNESTPNFASWASWGRDVDGSDKPLEMARFALSVNMLIKINDVFSLKMLLTNTTENNKLPATIPGFANLNICAKFFALLSFLMPNLTGEMAKSTTEEFQALVHDNPISIPSGVKKIEIYYQHTPAILLFGQPDEEYIQNLWGMVSPSTISCEDGTIDLNKYKTDLTQVGIDGIGEIGHNQVPDVYQQLWVETGDLNRTAPTAK